MLTWAFTFANPRMCTASERTPSYLLNFAVDQASGNVVFVSTITDGSAAYIQLALVSTRCLWGRVGLGASLRIGVTPCHLQSSYDEVANDSTARASDWKRATMSSSMTVVRFLYRRHTRQ